MNSLIQFLDSRTRIAWITSGPMRVYVRKAKHIIAETLTATLDVASISVNADSRGKGVFKAWLAKAEKLANVRGLTVRVESILEPKLLPFLTHRGYVRVPDTVPQQVDMYLPMWRVNADTMWFCDASGVIHDVASLDIRTYQVERVDYGLVIHVGGYDLGEPGFRVDDTYDLHSADEAKPAGMVGDGHHQLAP